MFRKDADVMAILAKMETKAALFAFPKESTMSVDLSSGLSFYRASFYDFMIEEEDLDL